MAFLSIVCKRIYMFFVLLRTCRIVFGVCSFKAVSQLLFTWQVVLLFISKSNTSTSYLQTWKIHLVSKTCFFVLLLSSCPKCKCALNILCIELNDVNTNRRHKVWVEIQYNFFSSLILRSKERNFVKTVSKAHSPIRILSLASMT